MMTMAPEINHRRGRRMGKPNKSQGSRRSLSQWRALFTKFDRSGQQVQTFCRNEAISKANFYRWRKLLQADDEPKGNAKPPAAPTFLDLGALTPPTKNKASLDLTLDLGDGLILRLIRH